ncbi:MAG: ClpXP protease specificity-enhancing factor [Gammaproteobacteria bacterium]|nr:ClpXP protease specificity-enhancing factor [Gammaproteobacteria bacterium]MDH3534815.1 ClpXP protease specificity-enhancing factor [Gammaproteobacteria bacterium]
MTPSKPYLVRALYEWILDNEKTPYILVDTGNDEVRIPAGIATDGKVVLNLAPPAIQNLEMTNDYLSFSARFNGVAEDIYCPIGSVMAIYARENGEGMMFPAEDSSDAAGEVDKPISDKPKGPTLKVIK